MVKTLTTPFEALWQDFPSLHLLPPRPLSPRVDVVLLVFFWRLDRYGAGLRGRRTGARIADFQDAIPVVARDAVKVAKMIEAK